MTILVETREQRHEFYNSPDWHKLRQLAIERDNYECVMCKAEGKVFTLADGSLEVDHIKELKDYPELALELDNLRSLCKMHHNKRHDRYNFHSKYKNYKPNKWRDDEQW